MLRRSALILVCVLQAGLGLAAELYVSPTGDDANDCLSPATACASIQHAIDAAAADDSVNIAAGRYQELLQVGVNLTLQGEPGVVVDAAQAGQALRVAADVSLTLNRLTIENGSSSQGGGGIYNDQGTVTLNDCVLRANQAASIASGGGVYNNRGSVTLNRSLVRGNSAGSSVGGGGGIYNLSGAVRINNSTLLDNTAPAGSGGAVLNEPGGTAFLTNSTLDGNSAKRGGAVRNKSADNDVRIVSSTITGSSAETGGALQSAVDSAILVRNTILWDNTATGGGPDCAGVIENRGNNLLGSEADCTLNGDTSGNLLGIDPQLEPLAASAGSVPVRRPASGSPAIDAGEPIGCRNVSGYPLTTDQLGVLRPTECGGGLLCDIGAIEVGGCAAGGTAIPPSDPRPLKATKLGADVVLSWPEVTTDAQGGPETIDHYKLYQGLAKDFVPDRTGGSNLLDTTPAPSYTHAGVAGDDQTLYYLASAVDSAGSEGATGVSRVLTPPVLSGSLTADSIELSWGDAEPVGEVAGYRVYWGPGTLDDVTDVGLTNNHVLTPLAPDVTYLAVVSAYDADGNESGFSNSYSGGISSQQNLDIRIMDQGHMCWQGRGPCDPNPGEIQRDQGRELLVPVDLPGGAWTRIELTLTLNSYATGATNCVWPDPGGDIYDRLFSVFMLVDDEACLTSGSCWGRNKQLELMHGVTPFGTDTRTGPRVYTVDITPFAPLLAGRRYIGINTTTWDGGGWWADIDLSFTADPLQASPKPPASGFQLVHNSAGPTSVPPESVSIPATASDVKVRLWVSGHGSATATDGCRNPADEFCPKTTNILVDGSPVWTDVPWRTDCTSATNPCRDYNACGWTSCTYDRSAWCPGWLTCHDDEPCDQDLDAAGWLPAGETHDLQFMIEDPTPGSWWSYSLVVYWYE